MGKPLNRKEEAQNGKKEVVFRQSNGSIVFADECMHQMMVPSFQTSKGFLLNYLQKA